VVSTLLYRLKLFGSFCYCSQDECDTNWNACSGWSSGRRPRRRERQLEQTTAEQESGQIPRARWRHQPTAKRFVGKEEGIDEVVEGFQFLNNGATDTIELSLDTKLLSQHKAATGQVVPQSWILLDNQSTVDVFSNRDLLVNIRKATNDRAPCQQARGRGR
jgi:hypothetical protein